jgi:endonuclease III
MTQPKSRLRSSSNGHLPLPADELTKMRRERAARLVRYLKEAYPEPKSELKHSTPFQFVAAVVLSAQCTDKAVNKATDSVFKDYQTPADFAAADPAELERRFSSLTFFRAKTRYIIAAAQKVLQDFHGEVPRTATQLQTLPGVGYKTAHVILGELFDSWEGIPTDTHVKRFARRFGLSDHSDLEDISHDLEELIPKQDWKYVNNGLVLYGRYICPARAHACSDHPLSQIFPESL